VLIAVTDRLLCQKFKTAKTLRVHAPDLRKERCMEVSYLAAMLPYFLDQEDDSKACHLYTKFDLKFLPGYFIS
jgi:hypothetical protein